MIFPREEGVKSSKLQARSNSYVSGKSWSFMVIPWNMGTMDCTDNTIKQQSLSHISPRYDDIENWKNILTLEIEHL